MHWGGELLGYANRPGDILADEKALTEAKRFFAPGRWTERNRDQLP
jgi:hypothetical protein